MLILGGGINGAAIARELILNDVPTWLVDIADLASGTTSYSSRLIHGGLRYLEYGEFGLVRESLAERSRLLRAAPHLVRPLRFHIPVATRWSGWGGSVRRFLGRPVAGHDARRGLYLVRCGLWLYDRLVRAGELPRSAARRCNDADLPRINCRSYRWICSYSDAQVLYPERLVLAFLTDAARVAAQRGVEFAVLPYHRASRSGPTVTITDPQGGQTKLQPRVIVNATGAWVDQTLARLDVAADRLIQATKGSHVFTWKPQLRAALGEEAVYAEARDGRPVFLLPWASGTLIGTTDIVYDASPGEAVASEQEIQYLLDIANHVVPDVNLSRDDVDLHYCGLRPLPHADPSMSTGGVTRRHHLVKHHDQQPPILSIVGGKLTTCRSLAEHAVREVMEHWNQRPHADSRKRLLPGSEVDSRDPVVMARRQKMLAARLGLTLEPVRQIWSLCGSEAERRLESGGDLAACVTGTGLPQSFIGQLIEDEWVTKLEDLVERRLMLIYDQNLTRSSLRELAVLLVASGRLDASQVEDTVNRYIQRAASRFGRSIQ